MDLHQIERPLAPQALGALHLLDAVPLQRRPYLGRGEQPVLIGDPFQAIADHLLRRAVHGRRIDRAAAGLEERPEHLDADLPRRLVVADTERQPRPHTDDRQPLTCLRDSLGQRRHGGGRHGGAGERNHCAQGRHGGQERAARDVPRALFHYPSPRSPLRWPAAGGAYTESIQAFIAAYETGQQQKMMKAFFGAEEGVGRGGCAAKTPASDFPAPMSAFAPFRSGLPQHRTFPRPRLTSVVDPKATFPAAMPLVL